MKNIVTLFEDDLERLANEMMLAAARGQRVRVTTTAHGMQVAVGGGMWTLPFGEVSA